MSVENKIEEAINNSISKRYPVTSDFQKPLQGFRRYGWLDHIEHKYRSRQQYPEYLGLDHSIQIAIHNVLAETSLAERLTSSYSFIREWKQSRLVEKVGSLSIW